MRHSSNGIRHKPSKLTIGIRVPDGVPNCLSVGTGIHLGLQLYKYMKKRLNENT